MHWVKLLNYWVILFFACKLLKIFELRKYFCSNLFQNTTKICKYLFQHTIKNCKYLFQNTSGIAVKCRILLLLEKIPRKEHLLHGRYSPLSSKMRNFCNYFLILPYSIFSRLQNYYIFPTPANILLTFSACISQKLSKIQI